MINQGRVVRFTMSGIAIETAAQAIAYLIVILLGILLAWWALQAFRFDIFVKEPKSLKARVLQLIFAVVLGYNLARFLLDYAYFASFMSWIV
jgi:uncharacterized integral membrane protein (TIGR02327 family)